MARKALLSSVLLLSLMSSSSLGWGAESAPSAHWIQEQLLRALPDVDGQPLAGVQRKEADYCTIQSISCGQTIFGSLEITDCGTTSNIDFFQIKGNYAATPFITATLTSTAFGPFLGLLDRTPTVVTYSATSPTAQLQYKLTSHGAPWTLGVTGSSGTFEFGDYSLSLQCAKSSPNLILSQGRFLVKVDWQNQFSGASGAGVPVPASDSTGFFYFTDPSNYELVVKILKINGAIKVFYAELTNLHFTITVTDNLTGTVKTYQNTPGDCGAIDDNAFTAAAPARRAVAGGGSCVPGSNTLCLLNRRFAVNVDWMNQFNGDSGVGSPRSLSDQSGLFSFTDPTDVELVMKMVDFGDRTAFFYGALSNFGYDITVTDTLGATTKSYHNAAGNYCGGLDNNAFPP
ncbi:MAG TPA: hypothetical protein VHG32_09770 [Thermoanaerobaculia bacterium]|jgi:hypothetical protein|nr:hypothetical protein [Thermoanaerobaculia bacterium]